MGIPLGPTLANLILCHHETKWQTKFTCALEFKPALYRRYIDDTFLLFKNAYILINFSIISILNIPVFNLRVK